MFWIDYTVHSGLNKFRVEGDWPGEVMGFDKDGNKIPDKTVLYSPGDVYIVGEDGWLRKTDQVNALLLKHESNKLKKNEV